MAWGDGQPPCCGAGLWERPGGRGLILLLLIPHTKLPLIISYKAKICLLAGSFQYLKEQMVE